MGLGSLALSCLLGQESAAAQNQRSSGPESPTHFFPPRAKSVIFLAHGRRAAFGSSICSTTKPTLQQFDGQAVAPRSCLEGKRFAFLLRRAIRRCWGNQVQVSRAAPANREWSFSELFAALGQPWAGPTLAVIKNAAHRADQSRPGPAYVSTRGFGRFGRPSVGSWVSYGPGEREPRPCRLTW